MPASKSAKPVPEVAKPAAKTGSKTALAKAAAPAAPPKKVKPVTPPKAASKADLQAASKAATKSATKSELQAAADALLNATKPKPAKAKPAAKAAPQTAAPAKAASKTVVAEASTAKAAAKKPVAKVVPKITKATKADAGSDDADLSDIESELEAEPVVSATGEKIKPLRMKISKAKERALMKEFGLEETILSEEEKTKRRLAFVALIKLGRTRGYLTHGEISDHLPGKLVDAETLEVVISMLNDMGVAVYEQTPDAETLLLNNNVATAATEAEAEEEAEAALSTVDSEFGRTTDPVRMYMREMGTVELLTREGEIEIAKRIEGGLMAMMEAISGSPPRLRKFCAWAKKFAKARW